MCMQMFRVVFERLFLVMIKQAVPPTQPQTSGANGDYEVSKTIKVSFPKLTVLSVAMGNLPHLFFPPTCAHSPCAQGLRGDVPDGNPGDFRECALE